MVEPVIERKELFGKTEFLFKCPICSQVIYSCMGFISETDKIRAECLLHFHVCKF